MFRKTSPCFGLLLLLAVDFSLATRLAVDVGPDTWLGRGARSRGSRGADTGDLLTILFGDARRMFANHFFVEADVYFHSGYYPSIFDQQARPKDASHMAGEHGENEEQEHEKAMDFLGKPKDWIDRFGRNFFVTEHMHLGGGTEREILPWLRISASLDPQRIETYTVAAYWLRARLGKVKEAEQFLREGLRANPDSSEILFELGKLYYENYKDVQHARNLFQLALRKWTARNADQPAKAALFQFEQIMTHLARLEEDQGNYREAADYLENLLTHDATPNPEIIRRQIEELKQKADASPPSPAPAVKPHGK